MPKIKRFVRRCGDCNRGLGLNNRSGYCHKCASRHYCRVCNAKLPNSRTGYMCKACSAMKKVAGKARRGRSSQVEDTPIHIRDRMHFYARCVEAGVPCTPPGMIAGRRDD